MAAESNSETAVESLIARCNESLQRGKNGALTSLTAYRDAGLALLELKEILPRGEFGPVATKRCGCCKQWRARLMQVAREWEDISCALGWADNTDAHLRHKANSVDGALALLRAWRKAQNGGARPKAGTRARRPGPTEREVADLKKKLSAGAMYIAVLEQELAARTGTPNEKRLGIDAADRSEVQKVATSWLRPATDGEGSAAAHKLRALSCRLGWPIRDLLHACEIEGPADWTFTSTPMTQNPIEMKYGVPNQHK